MCSILPDRFKRAGAECMEHGLNKGSPQMGDHQKIRLDRMDHWEDMPTNHLTMAHLNVWKSQTGQGPNGAT